MDKERALGSRYQLAELIGRGSMGEVWKGVDDEGRDLAFKVLHRHLTDNGDMVSRFIGEKRLLTSVRDQHVVTVEDLVAEGSTLAIVMELVPGTDLRRALEESGTLPPAEVCRIGAAVAGGLAAIHDRRIFHRDIKPENILLDTSTTPPTPRITDFGVAKLAGDATSSSTALVGTPHYLAPELAEGASPSVQSDLYALGIMLYELSCGVTPFQGPSTMAVLRGHAERAPGRPGGMPNGLWNVVTWLLHKQPAERPGSARDLAAALEPLTSDLAEVAAIAPLTEPPAGSLVAGPATTTVAGVMVADPRLSGQDAVGTMAVPASAIPRSTPYPGGSYPGASSPGGSYPGAPYPGASYPGTPYPGTPYPGTPQPGIGYPGHPGAFPPGAPAGATPYPARRRSKAVPIAAGAATLALAVGAAYVISQRSSGSPAAAVATVTATATASPAATSATGGVGATQPQSQAAGSSATPLTNRPSPSQVPADPGGPANGPLPGGAVAAPQPEAATQDSVDDQARGELADLRSRSLSSTSTDGRYVLQLDSKWEGITDPYQTAGDGSHTFRARDILSRHQQLSGAMAQQGVTTLLLKASDFGHNTVTSHGAVWATLADPGGLDSVDAAKAACTRLFPDLTGKARANACVPRQLTPPH